MQTIIKEKQHQTDAIAEVLRRFGHISRNRAMYDMRIQRLAARIGDLEKQGWVFFPGERVEGDYIYRVRAAPGAVQMKLI